jgi:hypothetical protein
MKWLAVILFHNDSDLVEEQIKYWKLNCHNIIVFDHASTDSTLSIVNRLKRNILKIYRIPASIPFANNGVFEYVSKILIKDYKNKFD